MSPWKHNKFAKRPPKPPIESASPADMAWMRAELARQMALPTAVKGRPSLASQKAASAAKRLARTNETL